MGCGLRHPSQSLSNSLYAICSQLVLVPSLLFVCHLPSSAQGWPRMIYPSQPTQSQPGTLNNPHLAYDHPSGEASQASESVGVTCTGGPTTEVVSTTWDAFPQPDAGGFKPVSLAAKWRGSAAGAITSGGSQIVELRLEYSLDGATFTTFPGQDGYWARQNVTTSSCQTGGANYPCSFNRVTQPVALDPSVDTTLIKIRATQTATVSCPGQLNSTNASGAIGVYYARVTLGCRDERDDIIGEYYSFSHPWKPACDDFTQSLPSSSHHSFGDWNQDGHYSWAVLRETVVANSYCILENLGSVPELNSGYRNPASQYQINPNAMASRHTYGDAGDIDTPNSPSNAVWDQMRAIAKSGACGTGCVEPRNLTPNHFHVDYRPSCPTGW